VEIGALLRFPDPQEPTGTNERGPEVHGGGRRLNEIPGLGRGPNLAQRGIDALKLGEGDVPRDPIADQLEGGGIANDTVAVAGLRVDDELPGP